MGLLTLQWKLWWGFAVLDLWSMRLLQKREEKKTAVLNAADNVSLADDIRDKSAFREPLDWTLGLGLASHSTERVSKPDYSLFMLEKSVHAGVNVYLNILWNIFGLLFPRKLTLSVLVLFHTSLNIFLKAVLNDECVWQIICCWLCIL